MTFYTSRGCCNCLQVTKAVTQQDFEDGKVDLSADVTAKRGDKLAAQGSASVSVTLPSVFMLSVDIAVAAGQATSVSVAGTPALLVPAVFAHSYASSACAYQPSHRHPVASSLFDNLFGLPQVPRSHS